MLPISRILVPVDFSERSLNTLPYAKLFAARYQAEVVLVHVVSPFFMIPPTGLSGPAFIPVADSTVVERTRQLEEWAPGHLEGVEVRRMVYEGDPVAQIVALTASEEINLVVMSTHGYGKLRRFLIGSMAAKLLDDLACPVLTGVHLADSHGSEPIRISKILCAVDLGPQTPSLLSYASDLARDFGAPLDVVHALPAHPEFGEKSSGETRSNAIGTAQQRLGEVVAEATGGAAKAHIQEGEPPQTVCSFASSTGADLLVIGRGSAEVSAGRLRTNAYAMIRQSPCPVLSV